MRKISVFGLSAFALLRCREAARGTRVAGKQQRDARRRGLPVVRAPKPTITL
ncbi:hypothetical protein JAO76_15105 [Pontibacter sp. BT310]|uniref:Uncharacterized protein n=1 Tax=Pontibacter populi TaxID=890055 RepID=A0ABS6XEG1_9BACT|nr:MULTISPECIES: hypothetical protein [Pontibacter]MBJ6119536.1 hypothetical protein [Pontibacter sp. BT310]MBR0571963.1 hypothetical protein [Microvirga sp. STS03]MBW3366389.1 hypothetical protein [Pontibacter populi]